MKKIFKINALNPSLEGENCNRIALAYYIGSKIRAKFANGQIWDFDTNEIRIFPDFNHLIPTW